MVLFGGHRTGVYQGLTLTEFGQRHSRPDGGSDLTHQGGKTLKKMGATTVTTDQATENAITYFVMKLRPLLRMAAGSDLLFPGLGVGNSKHAAAALNIKENRLAEMSGGNTNRRFHASITFHYVEQGKLTARQAELLAFYRRHSSDQANRGHEQRSRRELDSTAQRQLLQAMRAEAGQAQEPDKPVAGPSGLQATTTTDELVAGPSGLQATTTEEPVAGPSGLQATTTEEPAASPSRLQATTTEEPVAGPSGQQETAAGPSQQNKRRRSRSSSSSSTSSSTTSRHRNQNQVRHEAQEFSPAAASTDDSEHVDKHIRPFLLARRRNARGVVHHRRQWADLDLAIDKFLSENADLAIDKPSTLIALKMRDEKNRQGL